MTIRRLLFVLVLVAFSATASALPPVVSSSGTDDDTEITLTILSATILGDSRSPCTVRLTDAGEDVELSDGDEVFVWVYEDDLAGDDLIFEETFVVTAEEVAGGIDRTFDCTGDFGDDIGGNLELYADARIEKAACGFTCIWDRPTSRNIDVAEVIDDEAEDDDSETDAGRVEAGLTSDRASRDHDYLSIALDNPSDITVTVIHDPAYGAIAAEFEGPDGERLPDATRHEGGLTFELTGLPRGVYLLHLQPTERPDYNFYDVDLAIDAIDVECTPEETDSTDCGRCGVRTRSCGSDGRWESFGECTDEGACDPGSVDESSCGDCGTVRTVCSVTCEWEAGECTDEGECAPGAVDAQACGVGGTRERTCVPSCEWTAFSTCDEPSGPDCSASHGGRCERDDQCCDGWSCLGGAEEPWFPSGYCGSVGCTDDTDCPTGSCVSVFGTRTCIAACAGDVDCVAGSRCLDFGPQNGCAPPCDIDDDCPDPALPRCDTGAGICVAGDDPGEDTGTPPDAGRPDAGTDTGGSGADTGARPDTGGTTNDGGGTGGGVSDATGGRPTRDPSERDADDDDDDGGGGRKRGCAAVTGVADPIAIPLLLAFAWRRGRRTSRSGE